VAPKPARLAFAFGVVLAVAVTMLTIIMSSHHNLAESIPPTEAIYRPQHLNLY
jgi:hypothetical protein